MNEDDEMTGRYVRILLPYRGHDKGWVIEELPSTYLVRLTNGKEIEVYKSEVTLIK